MEELRSAKFTLFPVSVGLAQAASGSYVIGPLDVLEIRVWNEPQLSGSFTVRADGKISLQFVGDIQAASKTTGQLASDIETQLRRLIKDPQVDVAVQTQRSTVRGRVQSANGAVFGHHEGALARKRP